MRKLVLASTSPRRKEIFEKTGLKFEIIPSQYEEDMNGNLNPKKLVKMLALGKAKAVAKKIEGAVVIGADTIVVFDGKKIGKPKSKDIAINLLKNYSEKAHSVITGFAIIDTISGKVVNEAVETKVFFRKVSDNEIKKYVETGEPMGKAGGYAIQGLGAIFIDKIMGDYYNVMGLPLSKLVACLKKVDINVL